MVELVDTLALGASEETREGSSPFVPTKKMSVPCGLAFFLAWVKLGLRLRTQRVKVRETIARAEVCFEHGRVEERPSFSEGKR